MTTDATRESCLDAETLAAWVDGGLTEEERSRVDEHLSNCDRCQMVLATLAEAMPAADVRATVLPFWARPPVRWAATGLAAAAAMVMWVWTGVPERLPVLPEPESTVADKQPAPLPREASRKASDQGPEGVGGQAPAPTPAAALPAPLPPLRAPPPPPPPPIAPVPASPPPPGALPAVTRSEEVTVSAAAPVVDSKKTGVGFGVRTQGLESRATQDPWTIISAGFDVVVEVPLPDTSGAWRILRNRVGEHNMVQLLFNGAAQPMRLDILVRLEALSAPKGLVCWVVGAEGTVYRTVDGVAFQKLPFPEPVDLTGVLASSAEAATVTSQDGRRFTTSDAGKTWQQ